MFRVLSLQDVSPTKCQTLGVSRRQLYAAGARMPKTLGPAGAAAANDAPTAAAAAAEAADAAAAAAEMLMQRQEAEAVEAWLRLQRQRAKERNSGSQQSVREAA